MWYWKYPTTQYILYMCIRYWCDLSCRGILSVLWIYGRDFCYKLCSCSTVTEWEKFVNIQSEKTLWRYLCCASKWCDIAIVIYRMYAWSLKDNYCGPMTTYGDIDLGQHLRISGNGLLPYIPNPLPEPTYTYYQWNELKIMTHVMEYTSMAVWAYCSWLIDRYLTEKLQPWFPTKTRLAMLWIKW